MPNYSAKMQRVAGAAVSVGSLTCSATLRRAKIFELIFGSEGTAGDNPFLWIIRRVTAPGTYSAVTPTPTDPAEGAASTIVGENHTVEPTYTANANLLYVPLNQRATFRWVAVREDGKLVLPATQNNGAGVLTPVMAAVNVTAQAFFEE
jgi:hypothetical protein